MPFIDLEADLKLLKARAAYRAARSEDSLPRPFKEFLDRNLDAVKDEVSFRKGFLVHFEAVVAYCAEK